MLNEELEALQAMTGKPPSGSKSVAVHIGRDGEIVAVIPSAYERLTEDQKAVVGELQVVAAAMKQASLARDQAAATCRALGVPWELIAWSSGMSVDGARSRWGRRKP